MPDYYGINPHGLQGKTRVEERLALFHTAGGGSHVDDVSAENFTGFFERNAGARAGLVKQRHDDAPSQSGNLFDVAGQDFAHRCRVVQNCPDLLGREIVQIQNMPARRPVLTQRQVHLCQRVGDRRSHQPSPT